MMPFSLNAKIYETDIETLDVLGSVHEAYRAAGSKDASAIAAMMYAGLKTGRIREITPWQMETLTAADDSAG